MKENLDESRESSGKQTRQPTTKVCRIKRRGSLYRCSRCKTEYPPSAFKIRINGHLHSWCNDCKREYDHECYINKIIAEAKSGKRDDEL